MSPGWLCSCAGPPPAREGVDALKATKPQLDKALLTPARVRCFLFHGPDEAGSRALARRVAAALGPNSERIDLTAADLKVDPARLADEAASISMFGDARSILVDPAGDEAAEAVTALLAASVAGNPVALVAGALKPASRLLKLALGDPATIAFASYVPEVRDWDRIVTQLARERGLIVASDVARRVAEAAAGNRALIEQELGKFALYLDVAPGRTGEVDHAVVDAVGVAREDGDLSILVGTVFEGRDAAAGCELAGLRGEGVEGITLLRAALRRALQLARLRIAVERGQSVETVLAGAGKSLFARDKDAVGRALGKWPPGRLARSVARLIEAERDVKRSGGPGAIAADAELLALARQARRLT